MIKDEDVDVAVNTPNEVHLHLNDLLGGKIGVAYVCVLDKATACTGTVNAAENHWGCPTGPGRNGCSTATGPGNHNHALLAQPDSGGSKVGSALNGKPRTTNPPRADPLGSTAFVHDAALIRVKYFSIRG